MPTLPPPRAILFDLDDTILDDSGETMRLWREVATEGARRLHDVDAEGLLAGIEGVRNWYWSDPERHREGRQNLRAATRQIVAQAFAKLGIDRMEVATWIANEFRDRRDVALSIFPGAIDLLEKLRADGIASALLTNGSSEGQRAKIERFDLARHFDCVLIEGEQGVGKPDPRVYRTALAALSCRAEQSWMVGDNLEWDVAAPQRLGIRGIWIDRHGHGIPPDTGVVPDRIIRQVTELLLAVATEAPA